MKCCAAPERFVHRRPQRKRILSPVRQMQQYKFFRAQFFHHLQRRRCGCIRIGRDNNIRFGQIASTLPLQGRGIARKPDAPTALQDKTQMGRIFIGCADMSALYRCYRYSTCLCIPVICNIRRAKNDPACLPLIFGSKVGVIMVFMRMGKGNHIRPATVDGLYLGGRCGRVGFQFPAHTVQ